MHEMTLSFDRSSFRVRGDVIEIHLAYEDVGIRIELLVQPLIKSFALIRSLGNF